MFYVYALSNDVNVIFISSEYNSIHYCLFFASACLNPQPIT